MPIRIEDRATGNITTIEAPDETNQVIVYDGTSGASAKPAPVVITDDAEFQRVGAGSVDMFTDADTTALTIGSDSIPVTIESNDMLLGATGADVDVQGADISVGDSDAELNLNGEVVNIGTSSTPGSTTTISGKTINIGEADSVVNIIGSVSNQSVTNLNVSDKLITVNDGGAAGSGNGAGIEVEENSVATGYVKVSADRNAWELKAPNQTGIATIEVDGDNFEIDKTIVKGPTSGADNRLLKSDGTNGRLLQESGVTVDDSNNISGVGTLGVGTITSSGDVDAVNVSVSGKFETNETAERVLTTNASGEVTASSVTTTTLGYLDATSSIQTQLNANATAISDHVGDTTAAHAASAVSNIPSGNLAATNQQDVNNELQTDIDTRATSAALTAHTGATSAHGVSGNIVGTTDSQTLTNKTIVAANNTITTAASGNLISTELNASLAELQTDIDTRATSAALTSHTGASAAHGTSGDIVGTSDTQTLTNKTVGDALTFDLQGSTPANPSAGFLKIYPKDDGKVYKLDSSGNEDEIGTGSGTGGINYVEGGDAEDGTTGYARYDDGASSLPVDGTGGSPDAAFTFTAQQTNILRGENSFRITKDANNRQGHGVATEITIDPADRNSRQVLSFDYETSANYVDDDILISVWDENNAQIIRINGENLKAGKGTHYAAFQTFSDSSIMRIIFHVSSTNANAYTVDLDNIQCGPKNLVYGVPATDPKASTATVNWIANTTHTAKEYRIGKYLYVEGNITLSGAPTSATLTLTLPYTIDTTVIDGDVDNNILGSFDYIDAGARGGAVGRLRYATTTTLVFTIGNTDVTQASPITFANTDEINYRAKIPIVGWSSNSKMSEDFGGRQIYVYAENNSGDTVTADTEDIPFITTVKDTAAAWSNAGNAGANSTDAFTAPKTAEYDVTGCIFVNTSSRVVLMAYVDGAQARNISDRTGTGIAERHLFSFSISLIKGQVLTIRSSVTITLSTSALSNWISIAERTTAQQIFETEECNARYSSNAGATVTAGSPIIFEDLGHDTHGMMNTGTGVLTCRARGKYRGTAKIKPSSSQTVEIGIEKNGTEVDVIELGTISTSAVIPFQVELNVGDTLEVTNSAGTSLTLNSTSANNVFEIERLK